MSISEPVKIITPWASTGSKNPIPANANNTTGAAGFDKGFPDITMTPAEAGGIPPAGQDFNGILYLITEIIRYMQAGGIPTFSQSMSLEISGYPKGVMVIGEDKKTIWISKIDGNTSNPNSSVGLWDPIDIGLLGVLSSNWAVYPDLSISIIDTPPLLPSSADNRIEWERSRAALRSGIRDVTPLDDPKSHFRGFADKDTWNNPAYQGVGSQSFGRNGAAYAYLTTTFGHDCVTLGAASIAGGAGSATGNPDAVGDDANFGYCSIAWGKYVQAKGRMSYAFGENSVAGPDGSFSRGKEAITGPCVAGMPNPIGAGPVISDGIGAVADGEYVQAYGNGARAVGQLLTAYNGAHAYGYGINLGSKGVNAVPGSMAWYCNSDIPAEITTPAPGTNGGFGRKGWNTGYPNERFEGVMKSGDKFALRLEDGATDGYFDLQSTVAGGIVSVVQFHWENDGTAELQINGQSVVKNRAAAIPDNITDSNKIQLILDALRYHGLIAT